MKYLSIFFGIGFSLLLFSCSSIKKNKVDKISKPNILFIAVDDLRPELNLYGANHIKSPNLDNLAEKEAYKDIVANLSKTLHDNWGNDFLIDVGNLSEKRGQDPD